MTDVERIAEKTYYQVADDWGALVRLPESCPEEAAGKGDGYEEMPERDYRDWLVTFGLAWGIAKAENPWLGTEKVRSLAYRAATEAQRAYTTVGGLDALREEAA